MCEFVLTVGISSSGKSTWAYAQEDYIILDSDKIRGELYNGDETCQDSPDKVFNLMYKRAVLALSRGESVIYCATNLAMRHRIHLLHQLRSQLPDIHYRCVIFNTPIEICRKMNQQRNRQVPDWLFERQVKQFQCPVYNEGWDEIEIVKPFNWDKVAFNNKIWSNVRAFGSQNNPNHTLTLYEHLDKCMAAIDLDKLTTDGQFTVLSAARLHDIGKVYTKIDDESGISHYYSHENYGSYLAMNMGSSLETIQLINYHMIPYNESAIPNWKKRLGNKLWDRIMILHKADLEAH